MLFLAKDLGETLAAKVSGSFVLDVLPGNDRAVLFYKKHGYKIVDDRSVKLGEQEYPLTVFRKLLVSVEG